MPDDLRRARDLELLDAVDALAREPFEGETWRIVREGRDPCLGGASLSRWCNGRFEVLYTALDRDGAGAEIHALLSSQPVFPSRPRWFAHRLRITGVRTLHIADMAMRARLGVDVDRWGERDYGRTQDIADAAHFLGFDGLVAPSARWSCANLMLFTDRLAPDAITVVASEPEPIDWMAWRLRVRR
ncbi:RES family NAD+ phosphorylase [Rhodoplanes sp. TEM]|uniref:RES family NAD+ phosphorylase n=1 Tax=Rhodoplanes tepidamans TaxID=200616 RepID=A0ABT5JGQ6_RHOTP|nr:MULTISPECIES: RES family NAD+ phosphorylase [Rhodoplanes]MDC7788663.1 RES family NAD+ phosphorylase [Rhodoplanes tepidamans]MDC7984397.1 RES family NAD+ phosphorylase [Rhodoplanes sp. TEM]MDQ0358333.1 hypothetical protein [Rhodoplanes tepidamans]